MIQQFYNLLNDTAAEAFLTFLKSHPDVAMVTERQPWALDANDESDDHKVYFQPNRATREGLEAKVADEEWEAIVYDFMNASVEVKVVTHLFSEQFADGGDTPQDENPYAYWLPALWGDENPATDGMWSELSPEAREEANSSMRHAFYFNRPATHRQKVMAINTHFTEFA